MRAMGYLIASLLTLLVGPLLLRLARANRTLLPFLDGFMLVAIGTLVLFEVLPESFRAAGWSMLPLAALGLFGPAFLERGRHRLAERAHSLALHLAMVGLMAHGFLDGAALAKPASGDGGLEGLPLAVILHRFTEGLTVWALLSTMASRRVAASYLGVLALATIGGFLAGKVLLRAVESPWIGLFQGLVGGSLLHVLLHAPGLARAGGSTRARASAAAGALAALAACWLLPLGAHTHGDAAAAGGGSHFADHFLHLAAESAPFLLVAYVCTGLMAAFLGQGSLRWLARGGRFGQALRGVAFGLPLPICSCGVIPLYRSLSLAGVPAAAGMSFLVATPELGIDAALLTIRFFGLEFALGRIACAALVALAVGIIVGGAVRGPPAGVPIAVAGARVGVPGGAARWKRAVSAGFGEMVDATGPWIVVGLLLAAAIQPHIDPEWARSFSAAQVPLLALLGMPTYVCASGATPLMAVCMAQGISPGAAIAFLLTGPATNITTFGAIARFHGHRIATLFIATMFFFACACGYAMNWIFPSVPLRLPASDAPLEPMALWPVLLLGVLFFVSFLRQGPRGFIGQVLATPEEEHEHGGDGPLDRAAEIGGGEHCHGHDAAPPCAAGGGRLASEAGLESDNRAPPSETRARENQGATMPYDPRMVQPMREELTRHGVEELRDAADVQRFMESAKTGTALLVVNSVCGCAAGGARPGIGIALRHEVKPDRVATVFAGQDLEATATARSYFQDIPPSSPCFALFKGGKVVHFVPRHMIEGRDPQTVAWDLVGAFDTHCAPAKASK